ncbi:hypothetical protein ABBQ32_013355 [Trebouxia sp. C0010 RCD-2024]
MDLCSVIYASKDDSLSEPDYQSACESDGEFGAQNDCKSKAGSISNYWSASDYESESECEAESNAVVELVHIPILSRSAPLPMSIKINSQAGAQSTHADYPLHPPPHHPLPVSGDDQQDHNLARAQQGSAAAGRTAAQLQPRLDIAKQACSGIIGLEPADGAQSHDGKLVDALNAPEAMSEGRSAECEGSAAQQASAVDTSEQPCLPASFKKRTGCAGSAADKPRATPTAAGYEAAGGGASKNLPSSGNRSPVQNLRQRLAKKLRPGCMGDLASGKQDKSVEGQQAAAASEQVPQGSIPAMNGEPLSKGKHGPLLKAMAGRCLQKVMPACMKPPPVLSVPHSQADVQPLTAVAGSGGEPPDRGSQGKAASWSLALRKNKTTKGQQAAIASGQVHLIAEAADAEIVSGEQQGIARGQRQGLSKLTGTFKRKNAASKQKLPAETLATQPGQKPSRFIAVVRKPQDLAQHADIPSHQHSDRQAWSSGTQPVVSAATAALFRRAAEIFAEANPHQNQKPVEFVGEQHEDGHVNSYSMAS